MILSKTKVMYNSFTKQEKIKIEDTDVEFVHEIEYLGNILNKSEDVM